MQVYTVGGWVRDQLLGRPNAAADRDWVVVGSTPEEMQALGFRPVGKDFPVFLHPQTHEEYALARTERKSAPGYRGFVVHAAPDVTLEQDLERRDLTINAMALDQAGSLVDPFGGQRDLQARVLRHVGPAFIEDPVRILRLARFAARFDEFSIAPETLALAQRIVQQGEADALVPERAWHELARGLMEARPSRMIQVLGQCGLLKRWGTALDECPDTLAALDRAASRMLPLPARFAILAACLPSSEALDRLLSRLRADQDSVQLARLLLQLRTALAGAGTAPERLQVLERADAIRRPERFELLLAAFETLREAPADVWRSSLAAVRGIDAGAIAARHEDDPAAIARALREARLARLS
ncbi:MAG TPA: CCA tRNA nucleotidyltransferase [Burkholderiaceae bacterium]|nr:CCA tRNA nucleotidyltransferase [Burkholderiaceae bacterium]